MWLITTKAMLADVFCTPDLDGGIGPVMMGTPIEAEDGRVAVNHAFSEVSVDWLEAYTGTVMVEELPPDFVVKSNGPS